MFFGTTTVFLGQEVHYHMIYTAYYTELNCKICNYAQKRRIFRKQIRAWRFFFGIMCFIYCAKTLKSPTLDISNTNFKSFLPFALDQISTKIQFHNLYQTSAEKNCPNSSFKSCLNFKILTKPCAQSISKSLTFFTKPQLRNLQQIAANKIVSSNSCNINKFWVGIFKRQGYINQVY